VAEVAPMSSDAPFLQVVNTTPLERYAHFRPEVAQLGTVFARLMTIRWPPSRVHTGVHKRWILDGLAVSTLSYVSLCALSSRTQPKGLESREIDKLADRLTTTMATKPTVVFVPGAWRKDSISLARNSGHGDAPPPSR
jgi:hypothetical protein